MPSRTRAAGLLAALGTSALLLAAAVPTAPPTLFPAGAAARTTAPAGPVAAADPPVGALPAATAAQELRGLSGQDSPIVNVDADGVVRAITAQPGQDLGPDATAFVTRYAAAFGLTKAHTLVKGDTVQVPGGDLVIRYQQHSAGLPILGGEIVLTTSDSGAVRGAITGTTTRVPAAGAATVSPADARATAVTAAAADFGLAAETLSSKSSLWLYAGDAVGDQLRPTYWVKLADSGHEVATVLVDGLDGSVRLTASEHRTGEKRRICDDANARVNLNQRSAYVCSDISALGAKASTRVEGGPGSTVGEVNTAYGRLGVAYNYFKSTFGRDSYDGHGAEIRATVRACDLAGPCPYGNAFWDGGQFVFGQGWITDDVVAHEFTHAVTEHASNLYYWGESGAINEALSDIFGEFIDLATPDDGTDDTAKAWQIGEDLPTGAIRNMANPGLFGDPSRVRGMRWATDPLADNGGVHTNSGPANRAAQLIYAGGDGIMDNLDTGPVTGIGAVKSSQLWYRVMHQLPSGANYAQLSNTLLSACMQLVGHWGFTRKNCIDSVSDAVFAVTLGQNNHFTPDQYPAVCPNNSPPQALFSDDLEHGAGKWRFSENYYWQAIPSSDVPYSFANSGRHSINGWSPGQGSGNGTYVETAQAITLPAGSAPKLYFAHSMLTGGSAAIDLQYNDGGGWLPAPSFNNSYYQATQGYEATHVDLANLAGKTVKLRFNLRVGSFADFYLDDIWVYTCGNSTGPSAAQYGFHTTGGMSVNWAGPLSVAMDAIGTSPQHYEWELAYQPAIPGAPTQAPEGSGWNSLLISQADPATTYRVTIVARTADGVAGLPVVMTISPTSPIVCPNAPRPHSLNLAPAGRRATPGLPAGQCFRAAIPRR